MTTGWHYWLFEGEEGRLPLPVEETDPKIFTSLDDARQAAQEVGRRVDIYRTPFEGGMAEFVETVPPEESEQLEIHDASHRVVDSSPLHVTAKGEVKAEGEATGTWAFSGSATGKSLERRWNVIAPDAHVRQIVWHPPSEPGEAWMVEARDDEGNVLNTGMGDPQSAYLDLWDDMKPPGVDE
jgi:hypothetical protein